MPRLRLIDFRQSDGPKLLGICADNVSACANVVNRVQPRLVYAPEAGDEGWWGTFAEVRFNNVSQTTPYLTCTREVARVEYFDICNKPVPLYNQYMEYLQFGNGRMPQSCPLSDQWRCLSEAYTRNNAITFIDPTINPFILRLYTTDAQDVTNGKRVLIQGRDATDSPIYTMDNGVQVQGVYVDLANPFADCPTQLSLITGIQKDVTLGQIQFFQVDPVTAAQTLLLTMDPQEQVSGYRRYYLHNLPRNCCRLTNIDPVQNLSATAIVKLELLPVKVDTDYLLLQNLEAIIEEGIAIRMSGMDNVQAQQISLVHHKNAVRLLNSEITHYLGKHSPAVSFKPFGSARLERQRIGTLI